MKHLLNHFFRHTRHTPRFWIVFASGFISIAAFFFISYELREHFAGQESFAQRTNPLPVDVWVYNRLKILRSPWLTQHMVDITALGSMAVLTLIGVSGVITLLFARDGWGALYLASALLGANFWQYNLKLFFNRDRPDVAERLVEVNNASFPSGHSLASAAGYFAVAFLFSRTSKKSRHEAIYFISAALIILLVGFSRIYLGAHFFTDVAAGVFAGSAWVFFLSAIYTWFSTHERISKGRGNTL